MTLREYLQDLVRDHRPLLSTGAYGDEGQILFELDDLAHSALISGVPEQSEVGLTWLRNPALPDVAPETLQAMEYLVEVALSRTPLLRETLPVEEIARRRDQLYYHLTYGPEGALPNHLAVYSRYANLLVQRKVGEIVRGGEEWLILRDRDCLSLLGPFLVEVEPEFSRPSAQKAGF